MIRGPLTEAEQSLLLIAMEILVRKFGVLNTLVIEDLYKTLEGAPRQFGVSLMVAGDSLVIHTHGIGDETITADELRAVELKDEETIH